MSMRSLGKLLVSKLLLWCTKFVLWRFRPLVIAIAGTTNKTNVKNAILSTLPKGIHARANPKSYNTEIGLPLAVLSLPSGGSSGFRWFGVALAALGRSCVASFPRLLVLELGVDSPGDMATLLKMVRPTVLVLTSILDRQLLSEFLLAVSTLPHFGCLVLHADDSISRELRDGAPCSVWTYGMAPEAMFRISDSFESPLGMEAKIINTVTKQERPIKSDRYGLHHLSAIAAAEGVQTYLQIHPV